MSSEYTQVRRKCESEIVRLRKQILVREKLLGAIHELDGSERAKAFITPDKVDLIEGAKPFINRNASSCSRPASRRDKVELIVKLRSKGKTNSDIASTIGMDTHTLKNVVTRLIKRGLLERRPPGRPVSSAGSSSRQPWVV